MNSAPRRRATSLSPPDRFLLDQWADQIATAFGYGFPVLVGSAARAEPWRDIDVRLLLPHDVLLAITGLDEQRHKALDVAFSLWGQKATGLPIDFQFQSRERNEDGPRLLLGVAQRGDVHRGE